MVRGSQTRQALVVKNVSAIEIQRSFRGAKDRARVEHIKSDASVVIQRLIRGHCARHRVEAVKGAIKYVYRLRVM